MEIFLDPRQGVATQLFEQLREAIVSGRLRDGEQVPPSRVLARELGVSRHTVTTAYGRLVAEGYLVGRAGGGTEVSYGAAPARRGARPTELHPRPLPTTEYVTPPPGPAGVDLRIGLPDPRLFPLTTWRRCVVTALQVAPTDGDPAGHPGLRRAIATWVGRSRGVDAEADNVVVTSGAQHAVQLVVTAFARPGDRVAFEEPGYAPIRDLLTTWGLEVVPVPVDDDGIVVDAVPTDVRLVYVTPSHQSPTGATMSLARRRALLELADRHEMAVIEDDYDSEYRLSTRPLEPLYRLDRHGRVVYVGTFSKTMSPTLRLGFAVLPAALAPAATKVAELTGASPPSLVQVAMQHFVVDGHLDRHLRRARGVYGERHHVVSGFVARAAADGLLHTGPTTYAGLHLAARLRAGVSEREIVEACRRDGVALTSTAQSWMREPTAQLLLLGYGRVELPEVRRGLEVVREVLERTA